MFSAFRNFMYVLRPWANIAALSCTTTIVATYLVFVAPTSAPKASVPSQSVTTNTTSPTTPDEPDEIEPEPKEPPSSSPSSTTQPTKSPQPSSKDEQGR